jgi:hypothetical protein
VTAGSFENASAVRAALQAIASDPVSGAAALDDPQVMANLLQDLLPDAPRETSLLTMAVVAGLPAMLRGNVSQGMDAQTAIRLAGAALAARTAFTARACEWAATELAVGLGLTDALASPLPEAPAAGLADGPAAGPEHEPTTNRRNAVPGPGSGGTGTRTGSQLKRAALAAGPTSLRPAGRRPKRTAILAATAAATILAVGAGVAVGIELAGAPHTAASGGHAPRTGGHGTSSSPAGSPASSPARTTSSAGPHLYTCSGKVQVRPASYVLSCASATMLLRSLTWSRWSSYGGFGAGQLSIDSCTPNCADGTYENTPVLVTLSDLNGGVGIKPYFTRLVISGSGPTFPLIYHLGRHGPGLT